MQEFDKIGEDLFNKIRGRFPEVTIGNKEGSVTNEPEMARFFDFDYNGLGKVSVAIDEDEGLTVIYSKDFMEDQDDTTQRNWYDFLKELRIFSKKRMMEYSVRDITKSNLNKRDYKFLAKTPEDENMNESKLYGTSRISYQKIGEARIVIKHTEGVNQESAAGRTRSIGKIYIESAEGERFIYPFKHLSGARAMARHVAEGGKPHDEFGGHIVGLSEEMSKLRKFNNYMGRSAVMAESLSGYVDAVKERISTVKKTIESLQKPKFYAETFAAYAKPMMEDVPSDVAENWIDQLTIKQFNEELADVFPYIYNLVSEATKAKSLGPEDLEEKKGPCWTGHERVPGTTEGEPGSCRKKGTTKEEIELEQGFEEMMGQFGEGQFKREMTDDAQDMDKEEFMNKYSDYGEEEASAMWDDINEDTVDEAYINSAKDASSLLGELRGIGKSFERGQAEMPRGFANRYASDVWDVYTWIESKTNGFSGIDKDFKSAIDDMMKLRGIAKKKELAGSDDSGMKDGAFGNQVVTVLYPVMQSIDSIKMGDALSNREEDKSMEEDEQKTPLGEFILSYFDRENGAFPKGETAVLTMVEKDYGEEYINPAKQFIEQVTAKFEEIQLQTQPQQMETEGSGTEADEMQPKDPKSVEVRVGNDINNILNGALDGQDMSDQIDALSQKWLGGNEIEDDSEMHDAIRLVVYAHKKDSADQAEAAEEALSMIDNPTEAPAESQNIDRIRELAGLR